MSNLTPIHRTKQPRRPHYLREWCEKYGLRQSDLANELNTDKSIVSRWFSGATPSTEWQARLGALFDVEPEAIFRHPDEDWLVRFFKDRTKDEIERIKATLEAAFPRRVTT